MAEAFRRRYADKELDLIITNGPHALEFAEHYRDRISPGVPIVFSGVSANRLEGKARGPGITGVAEALNLRKTIDLALRLEPDTTAVVVIAGATDWDKFWLGAAHLALLPYQSKIREIDLVGPPGPDLLKQMDALPTHTVALFQVQPEDSSQTVVGIDDLLPMITKRVPTYSCFFEYGLEYGAVGGVYLDTSKEFARTEEIAADVLNGRRPDEIPISYQSDLQVKVDWRSLQRWHIPESALPPGSIVINRPLSFWERDRKYIFLALALTIAQALLITALLWQRARKRKAEAVLRESEERFRRMADTTPSLIWMCDDQGKIIYLNERWLTFVGLAPDAGYGDAWIALVHSDDVENILENFRRALIDRQSFSREFRLRRSDGTYRWVFDIASPRANGDGGFAGFIGSAVDVTDQKLAQQALESLSGQLIEAQEKERARIARDLHDDICQRLVLLSMEIERAKRDSGGRVSATNNLEEIRQHCSEISDDVQSLSHQLHSSQLDLLGIVAALRGFCRELSKQHGVTIDFSDRGVPGHLPKDISLCLFRVAQESLHNAVKYSGTAHYKMRLSATVCEVRLEVTDTGAGFEVEGGKRGRGLGLVSMQERVHLVHGKFTIESMRGWDDDTGSRATACRRWKSRECWHRQGGCFGGRLKNIFSGPHGASLRLNLFLKSSRHAIYFPTRPRAPFPLPEQSVRSTGAHRSTMAHIG
jgi:PAS domain S-box-containing protein